MHVAMMSQDDRVMHLPSDEHGRAMCGETMRDPWHCGPLDSIAQGANEACDGCFDF